MPFVNRYLIKLEKNKLSIKGCALFITVLALLWAAVFALKGWDPSAFLLSLAASALLSLSLIDWKTYEIPFAYNVFIFALGVVALLFDLTHWYEYVIGFFAISLPLLGLFYLSKGTAIGGGDVKLMAACGMLLGWKLALLGFVLGCIIGSVVHILRMKLSGEKHVLAMGPYLSIGVFLAALFGDAAIAWYLSMLGL
ncbi:MAG: prepilin peptidase [Clostridia bacterium]|nr:prepilin peptidase [Clostridia bacterium]MBQ5362250.1 prepilin peptidase [Clostridia bacterium]MBQ5792885.1 prepilin peptidase [Clostridia bacterium]